MKSYLNKCLVSILVCVGGGGGGGGGKRNLDLEKKAMNW